MNTDRRPLRPRHRVAPGRPQWLGDFRDWLGGLPPAALADLIEALASELDARRLGGDLGLTQAAGRLRAHEAVRVRQLVDEFLLGPPTSSWPTRSARSRA